MNIGQLETALGMTRANIRFYEKEGLLSPARSENGYRDYTGSDLDLSLIHICCPRHCCPPPRP